MWNNKIAIVTYKHNLTALVIENADIAKNYETLFKSLWGSNPEKEN